METGFAADGVKCDNDYFMFVYKWIPKICLCHCLFRIINIYVLGKKYYQVEEKL